MCHRHLILAFVAFWLSQAAACAFHIEEVAPGIYRGEDAKRKDLKHLKEHGIKTILSVRTRRHHNNAAFFEKNGIHFIHMTTGVFKVPTDYEVKLMLSIITNPANQPVYMGCKGNRDRTSYYVGCYRILEEGKSYEEVAREFDAHNVRMWWPVFRRYKPHLREMAEHRDGQNQDNSKFAKHGDNDASSTASHDKATEKSKKASDGATTPAKHPDSSSVTKAAQNAPLSAINSTK